MTTSRLETFADGVFAIAATLLILNVDAQIGAAPADLGAGLLHMWPSYVAYAVSFLTIGIIWVNHHTVMTQVARADRTFLFLTVVFLLCVAFIPFPTRLVAEHVRDQGARVAALTYGITLTAAAVRPAPPSSLSSLPTGRGSSWSALRMCSAAVSTDARRAARQRRSSVLRCSLPRRRSTTRRCSAGTVEIA